MPALSNPIQSLWVGGTLSKMEQLCIASFLRHGHEFHLYVYEPPADLPKGVELFDAKTILPHSAVFKYADRDTYAGFSNLFRYKLLFEKGGVWVDMDMVCLAPFKFLQDYLFAEEAAGELGSCIIKAPAGSEVMRTCYLYAADRGRRPVNWGETGPLLLDAAVKRCKLQDKIVKPELFCPIAYPQYNLLVQEDTASLLQSRLYGAFALHLWNEMWRLNQLDKNQLYPASSLYETLKRRYLYSGQSESVSSAGGA